MTPETNYYHHLIIFVFSCLFFTDEKFNYVKTITGITIFVYLIYKYCCDEILMKL